MAVRFNNHPTLRQVVRRWRQALIWTTPALAGLATNASVGRLPGTIGLMVAAVWALAMIVLGCRDASGPLDDLEQETSGEASRRPPQ